MYSEYLQTIFAALKKTVLTMDANTYQDYDAIIEQLLTLFCDIKSRRKQVFFIGNGGSAAIASHMTADFLKNGGLKTHSLYDCAMLTCISNDCGYEHSFEKAINLLGGEGDLLVAISSSGNSNNIVLAVEAAKAKKMSVITLSGFKADNKLRRLGDLNLYVPISEYGIVESVHNLILQHIVDIILEKDGAAF